MNGWKWYRNRYIAFLKDFNYLHSNHVQIASTFRARSISTF